MEVLTCTVCKQRADPSQPTGHGTSDWCMYSQGGTGIKGCTCRHVTRGVYLLSRDKGVYLLSPKKGDQSEMIDSFPLAGRFDHTQTNKPLNRDDWSYSESAQYRATGRQFVTYNTDKLSGKPSRWLQNHLQFSFSLLIMHS